MEELCNTCKKINCNKNIVVIQEKNLVTIKCLEYEKDESKIQKNYVGESYEI